MYLSEPWICTSVGPGCVPQWTLDPGYIPEQVLDIVIEMTGRMLCKDRREKLVCADYDQQELCTKGCVSAPSP